MENLRLVKLKSLNDNEINSLGEILEKSFESSMKDCPEKIKNMTVPKKEDIRISFEKGLEIQKIYFNDELVGGIVLNINEDTNINEIELLFISPTNLNKGLGSKVWKEIENNYPNTKIWRLGTPPFQKRNIHFYINKCGFKIVEYFNKWHPMNDEEMDEDGLFIFEKVMK